MCLGVTTPSTTRDTNRNKLRLRLRAGAGAQWPLCLLFPVRGPPQHQHQRTSLLGKALGCPSTHVGPRDPAGVSLHPGPGVLSSVEAPLPQRDGPQRPCPSPGGTEAVDGSRRAGRVCCTGGPGDCTGPQLHRPHPAGLQAQSPSPAHVGQNVQSHSMKDPLHARHSWA